MEIPARISTSDQSYVTQEIGEMEWWGRVFRGWVECSGLMIAWLVPECIFVGGVT